MTLKDDMASDLSEVFFDEDDLASPAVVNPSFGKPYPISVIFEDSYEEVDPDTQATVISTNPRAKVIVANLNGEPGPGYRLDYGRNKYSIVGYQPDGLGTAYLVLHKE